MRHKVTIYVDQDEGVVRTSIAGLDFSDAEKVLKAALSEACHLIDRKMNLWRFRDPLKFRTINGPGQMTLEATDARGRVAQTELRFDS